VFVVGVTTIAVAMILPLEVAATLLIRLFVMTTVTSVMSFHHLVDLLIVPIAKLVTHLTSHALLNLAFTFLCQGTI
jgi:hypothetical protein